MPRSESSFLHSYQAPLLIYVGRLGVEKRLRDLRDVLSKLPGARLAFVGKGPDMEGLREYFAGESVPLQPRALNPHWIRDSGWYGTRHAHCVHRAAAGRGALALPRGVGSVSSHLLL